MPIAWDVIWATLLSPLLLLQAGFVVLRAKRLPEPSGPRSGTAGKGQDLRLLIVGDSSAAGVGVAQQEDALAMQLAGKLAPERRVTWRLCARNGATSADAEGLLATATETDFDHVLVVFGVNDVKNMRAESAWKRDLTALAATLRQRFAAKHIFFAALPPLDQFPLLPQPLRHVLGLRARRFDIALQQVCRDIGGVHVPFPESPVQLEMAKDGFHPSAQIYAFWAEYLARIMLGKT